MAIHRDDNSPAHFYAEQWRKDRKKELRSILTLELNISNPIAYNYIVKLAKKCYGLDWNIVREEGIE